MKHILFLLVIILTTNYSNAQTFRGQWAMTEWEFEFRNDGTYKRTSSGHFGSPVFEGNYRIVADTIEILDGYQESYGTLNPQYLIENDTLLIDLTNLYEYTSSNNWEHISKKRYDILPKINMDSIIHISLNEFDTQIKESTELLKENKTIQFTDKGHIQIIRLKNTIFMNDDSVFRTGIYKEFYDLTDSINYGKELSIYYDWIPSRGMGFYFQKLQIELGGTPHLWSMYIIEE